MADKETKNGSKEKTTSDKKPTAVADLIKSFMPIVVPYGVKMIMDMIPEGSKIDDVMKNYHKYWEKIAPAISALIMQLTNLSDIADDIIAEVNAEISRALKERYKKGSGEEKSNAAKAEPPVRDIIGMLSPDDFNKLITRISGKDKSSIDKFLNYSFGLKQAEAVKVLTNLAQADQNQFDVWFNGCFPKTEPKVPQPPFELSKKIADAYRRIANNENVKEAISYISSQLKEIRRSYSETLAKPTLFEKIADKLDIFNLRKKFNIQRRY